MRHKYATQSIVLARTPLGESSALIALLTPDLGLVYARAQGVRQSGAKLASALATFAESMTTLVRGREGWRLTGAVLGRNWYLALESASSAQRAARVAGLMQRLSAQEACDPALFSIFLNLLQTLSWAPAILHEAAEILASLQALAALGLDSGELPTVEPTSISTLEHIAQERVTYVARINRGISASGL